MQERLLNPPLTVVAASVPDTVEFFLLSAVEFVSTWIQRALNPSIFQYTPVNYFFISYEDYHRFYN